MAKFTSKIYKLGINPVVDPPDKILGGIFAEAGRSKGPIPVRGKLNGAEYLQTLVKYGGAWRLYINGNMLKDSGLNVGDVARVDIEFDPEPREVEIPPALAAALRKTNNAKAAFEKLTPSRRKEISRYLGSLKTPESIEKNVERIISHLHGEKTDHLLNRPGRSS